MRELFPLFWNSLECTHFDGFTEKVPVLVPRPATEYIALGKILSHGFVLTGYFLLSISMMCVVYLISGVDQVSDDTLNHSFFNFLDPQEAMALKSCLSEKKVIEDKKDIVIALFSRLNATTTPTSANLEELTKKVAKHTLVCQPYFALGQMRKGMLASHPTLWQTCDPMVASSLYNALLPDAAHVWDMVVEPIFTNPSEARVFDYFRCFIFTISVHLLCKLLQFVTGKPQCGLQSIKVSFCVPIREFERHPTASTCSMNLCILTTYETFSSFVKELTEVLNNSHMWSFDAL